MINLLKNLYYKNKFLFLIAIIGMTVFAVGCASQGSAPSGPIGGGC